MTTLGAIVDRCGGNREETLAQGLEMATRVLRSIAGRAERAVRDDETASTLAGRPTQIGLAEVREPFLQSPLRVRPQRAGLDQPLMRRPGTVIALRDPSPGSRLIQQPRSGVEEVREVRGRGVEIGEGLARGGAPEAEVACQTAHERPVAPPRRGPGGAGAAPPPRSSPCTGRTSRACSGGSRQRRDRSGTRCRPGCRPATRRPRVGVWRGGLGTPYPRGQRCQSGTGSSCARTSGSVRWSGSRRDRARCLTAPSGPWRAGRSFVAKSSIAAAAGHVHCTVRGWKGMI